LPADQNLKLAVLADLRRLLDSPALKRLPIEEQQQLKQLRPPDSLRALTDADVPQEAAWPYTERDGTRGKLILANTGLGVDTWRLHSLDHFANTLRDLQLGPHVVVGGSAFVFSDMISMMRTDGPRATWVALAGSAGIVLLLLGARRHGLVTLASAALGLLGMLSIVCLLGIKVNFLDFVALPITIGIGVDYAVNIAARAEQLPTPNAGRGAVLTTGPVVILCSFTTIIGYASLLFSLNRGIRTFGLCAMIGELTCLATAMIFTPALLDWRTNGGHNPIGTDEAVAENTSS
jgi:predicted RND superfamily exporter protein